MARFKAKDEEGKKGEKRVEQMTLTELRGYIHEQIEASEWHGANGAHIKKILTMPLDKFREMKKAHNKQPNGLYHALGVMRNNAVLMPEGYSGLLGTTAVDLRIEELARVDYAAEKQYGDMPEAKNLAKQKTIHE